MRSTRVTSVGIAILLLCSSAGVVALSEEVLPAVLHDIGSKTALDLHTMYLGKTLASNQPSPYCNFGNESSPFILLCYTPADLKVAYNFPTNLDGSGQTVVIVDAFGYPEVQADVNTFDAMFGLPYTKIQIVCQGGVCPVFNPNDPDQVSWSNEIAEDVQSVHSLAPGAHIVLFVGSNDDDLTLEEAVLSAVQMFPHSIISQSWGDPELDMLLGTCFDDTDTPSGDCSPAYVQETLAVGEKAYRLAAAEGTTVFAAAGDWGADNSELCYAFPSPCGFTSANPIYPSSSPWVTAVGGTMGNPYYENTSIPNCGTATVCSLGLVKFLNTPSCQLSDPIPTPPVACTAVGYGGEQVWNEPEFGLTSGGAPSLIFPTPWYQSGLGLSSRATPDVSADAAASGAGYMYSSAVAVASRVEPRGRNELRFARVVVDCRARGPVRRRAPPGNNRVHQSRPLPDRGDTPALPPGLPRHHGRQQHRLREHGRIQRGTRLGRRHGLGHAERGEPRAAPRGVLLDGDPRTVPHSSRGECNSSSCVIA